MRVFSYKNGFFSLFSLFSWWTGGDLNPRLLAKSPANPPLFLFLNILRLAFLLAMTNRTSIQTFVK
jgi:hypothetical protein